MVNGIKPWYTARWETVEPEEEESFPDEEYNEPTVNDFLDYEDRLSNWYFD
jgi:hypothetical protein